MCCFTFFAVLSAAVSHFHAPSWPQGNKAVQQGGAFSESTQKPVPVATKGGGDTRQKAVSLPGGERR